MKQLFFLLVITCFFTVQQKIDAQYRIGFIGGLTNSTAEINLSPEDDISSKSNFSVGALLSYSLNENLSLIAQPMYTQNGIKVDISSDNNILDITTSFLELPLFVKYSLGKEIKPYLLAGTTIGFMVSNDLDVDLAGMQFTGSLTDVTEKISLGVGLGAGVEIPFDAFNIFIEGQYNWSLSNLQKGGNFDVSSGGLTQTFTFDKDEHEYKYRGLKIMAGITLPL